MAEVIIMPKLGFNMDEGKLVQWYKKEGDHIGKGEALFSIETDKTSIDIEATGDGVVRKLFLKEGEAVPVTLPIAIIAGAGEDIDALVKEALEKLGKEESTSSSAQTVASAQASGAAPAAAAKDFDIIVIGGGPGGYVAAIKAAQLGKRTAVVEKDQYGGVCMNRGCIPTKTLLRSAESLKEIKESDQFGVVGLDLTNLQLDMTKVQKRKAGIVGQLVGGINGLFRKNGVTPISGEGIIKDKNTVSVGGKEYTADFIIIATGSGIKSLPVPIDSGMEVLTSNEALDLAEIPADITIIGGGVIGVEFAYFFASIGTKVTVVEFLDRILPMVDEEITKQVTSMLEQMGVKVYTSARVTEISKAAVLFEKDGSVEQAAASKVLMAVGRGPDLGGIDCEALGIRTERGAIVTDSNMRTSVENIYAVGDVNGKAMLAHTASAEGIIAAENICGHHKEMVYDRIPSAIYIQPEVACVGLTEVQAREKYGDVKIGRFPLVGNGKAKVAGDDRGMIKVITEPKYQEIVGVHIFGIHATDLIAEAAVAMNLEATAEEVAMSIHPHPTISEIYHEAFHAAIDKAIHI
ncbi:dihydrolipoyl dehydrogenase [Anoxybacterium hadale]|uniref:Dihydrolipoyl dehydrogenase n=1 Tax=Anoxybacterium hadale TaxID=3408580 RepID=A0ACD1A711_9FIRM|nr:dihydrolipoyl dehydrogenase [Clostridiales bacterium]